MGNGGYLGREFHRKSALDAKRTEAEQKLKEETRGQTLGEWFEKEKKKPAPKEVEDAETLIAKQHLGNRNNYSLVDSRSRHISTGSLEYLQQWAKENGYNVRVENINEVESRRTGKVSYR